jgi:hypothetical protein
MCHLNVEGYMGYCFRRSSASLLVDAGVDLLLVKRRGDCRSNTVAEGYLENFDENKVRSSEILDEACNIDSLTSNSKNVFLSKVGNSTAVIWTQL